MRLSLAALLSLAVAHGGDPRRPTDEQSCSSDAAAPALRTDVRSILIVVDSVEDRTAPSSPSSRETAVLASDGAHCKMLPGEPTDEAFLTVQDFPASRLREGKTGKCTLRAALEMAAEAEAAGISLVHLALRGGRFRLSGRLPEIVGSVRLIGSRGRSSGRREPGVGGHVEDLDLPGWASWQAEWAEAAETEGDQSEAAREQRRVALLLRDGADFSDHWCVGKTVARRSCTRLLRMAAGTFFGRHNSAGSAPIGTTLDGDEAHQLLWAAGTFTQYIGEISARLACGLNTFK